MLVAGFFSCIGCAADFTVEQWCAVEIPLTSPVSYADPFADVDVTATFTGPGGEVIERPAFWDGTNTWRIRFAPTTVGQWSMSTSCTDPSNGGLQGVTHTIQCDAYTGPYAIYQHGFLKVSPNGRYFVYADGTPFFYLGDTHWLYIHERFETSNVPGVASEFQYIVDKRVAQGFTVFQSEAIHIPQGGIHTNADEEPYAVLTNGFSAADLPGFWNIDQKFAYLASNGLVHANGFITWTADPATFPGVFTTNYMARLGRYWVARYGAYPVLWTTAQELDPNVYGLYNTSTIALWYAGAQALITNDAYAQPLGVHMQSNGNGINSPADSWWGRKPYHQWWPMQLQGEIDGTILPFVESFWTNLPTKPIVLYETPYEDFWTPTDGARNDGYKAFQWGMCGYGYGANGVWNDLYDYATSDWGTAYYMPGSYLKWYDGANLPGAGQLTYLKNFYTALDWWRLTPRFNDPAWSDFADPDDSLLSSASNLTYVAYFFGSGNSTGTLNGMAPGIPYDAAWFNPRTGIYTDLGGVIPTAGQWTAPAKPDSEDWVLLVKQNPATIFPFPANGATATLPLPQVAWSGKNTSSNLYGVYFGSAADYDPNQPYGNLVCLTPAGGNTNQWAALPGPLPPGTTYYWMLAVTNLTAGTTNLYTWSFTVATATTGPLTVGNPSFETPKAGGVGGGWAQIGAPWVVLGTSPYQQNSLTPTGSAHFTGTSPGGGVWYALLNGNTVSLTQDLQTNVNVGDTLALTFYGGRGQANSSTADGGVFTAAFLVGSTPYSLPVNTTVLANDSWQSYTLTETITNAGDLSLQFSAVSGDPWLDNINLSKVAAATAPRLSVTLTNPGDGQAFLTGAAITAAAAIANGTGPYTVTYYTNAVGSPTAVAGVAAAAPYTVALGKLASGAYHLRATVVDSASPSANTSTSLTHTFTVAPAINIPVANGSFETPGGASGSAGWAHIAAGWNPADDNSYQENNLNTIPGEHFTTISPGGGVWYALLNGNTGVIRQDLQTNVNVGDTLAMTFYGGRGRDGSSTADGGVFSAAFLVGSTPYGMQVDTTALAENSWQSFTLTQIVTNSGDLHLEFSAVSGDPWLDNLSNVTWTPASPYTLWIAGFPGVAAGQTGFADDPNQDGVANGLVWLLGGKNPLADGQALMPVSTVNAGNTLTLTFDCLPPAAWGTATLEVEYSHDLSTWTAAAVPSSNGTVNGVIFAIAGTSLLHVTAVIPNTTDNKLFARLRAALP